MNDSSKTATAHWPRPYWQPGGGDAELVYFVFGQFATDPAIDLPDGVSLVRYNHATLRQWEGYPLGGTSGKTFAREQPDTLAQARATQDVLRIAGTIKDPASLDYFRMVLHSLVSLFDNGAVAVADPLLPGLYGRKAWINDIASGNTQTLRQHLLIECSDDPDKAGSQWVHTRGMRKFGRPDISITGIPANMANQAGALAMKLADTLALGGRFQDGQGLTVEGIGTLTARVDDTVDDSTFFNRHITLAWPA